MFRNLTLRLTAFSAAIIVLILIASATAAYFIVRHNLQAQLSNDLRVTVSSFQRTERFKATYAGLRQDSVSTLPDNHHELLQEEETELALLAQMPYPVFLLDSQGTKLDLISGQLESEPAPGQGLPNVESASVALSGNIDERSVNSNGHWFRVHSVPVIRNGVVIGVVQAVASEEGYRRMLATLLIGLLSVGIGGVIISVLGGYVLTARALRPVRDAFERQRNFITDASHQLRTPVAVIQTDAEVLGRSLGDVGVEDAQILQDLVQESRFLSRVINQLLDSARLEGRDAPTEPEPLDLAQIVQETARADQVLAAEKNIAVLTDISSDDLSMKGNTSEIRLALLGLLDNAIKYNRPGGTVKVQAYADGPWRIVSIANTGAGLTQTDQQRVFQRFYRGENARGSKVEGTGLGLNIARQIAQRHGGDVTLENRPGEGTTATLRLRAAN